MNFVISSSSLVKVLQTLSGVLSTNPSIDILNYFLFEVKGNKLTVTSSDLVNTMKANVDVQSSEDGSIALSARLLIDTIKTFPEQPLTFSTEENILKIRTSLGENDGKYELAYLNGDDFPKPIALENTHTAKIKGDILASAIEKTLFTTSNDDSRPNLTGVLFQMSKSSIIFVGTDSHKLSKYKRLDFSCENEADIILPKKSLGLLKNISAGVDDEVVMAYNEANIAFSFQNIELTCRLIDGKYPNYEAVIPQENPNKLIVNRTLFLNTLKRVSAYSSKDSYQARFIIKGTTLQVIAEDKDFNNKAEEKLACNYTGDDMEIGFNSKLLAEMVAHLESEEIAIKMSLPNKAGIISPVDGTEDNEDILMLAMPYVISR